MFYCLLLILFIVVLYTHKLDKVWFNPVFLFVSFWTILMILSSLNLYNQNSVSLYIYQIVTLGCVCFAIGGWLVYKRKDIPTKREISRTPLPNFIYKISKVECLLLLFYFVRTMFLWRSGASLDYIRSNFTELVIHNSIERMLWAFVVYPLAIATMATNLYIYFIEGKKMYILVALVLTMLIAFTSGGRVYFFFFLIQVAYFSLTTNRLFNIKTIVTLFLLVFVSKEMLEIISNARNIESSANEGLYTYFTGCFVFLESKMTMIDTMGFHSLGLAFFNAPVTFIEMILKNAGLMDYTPLLMQTNNIINSLQEYENIGSANFNAFASIFFSFYMDAGILGVAFFSFLSGAFSSILYVKARQGSVISIIAFSIILDAIFTSFVRWQFGKLEFFLSIVYVWLLLRNYKVNHHE